MRGEVNGNREMPLMLEVSGRDSILIFDFLNFEVSLWERNDKFLLIRLEFVLESGLIETIGLVFAKRLECFGFLMRLVFGMVDFCF